jgi:hypothetical protein
VRSKLHLLTLYPRKKPDTRWLGDWAGPSSAVNVSKKKMLCSCRECNPGPSIPQLSQYGAWRISPSSHVIQRVPEIPCYSGTLGFKCWRVPRPVGPTEVNVKSNCNAAKNFVVMAQKVWVLLSERVRLLHHLAVCLKSVRRKTGKRRNSREGGQWDKSIYYYYYYYYGGKQTKYAALKFPRQCPLILLLKADGSE